jgi:hypothetical protein
MKYPPEAPRSRDAVGVIVTGAEDDRLLLWATVFEEVAGAPLAVCRLFLRGARAVPVPLNPALSRVLPP